MSSQLVQIDNVRRYPPLRLQIWNGEEPRLGQVVTKEGCYHLHLPFARVKERSAIICRTNDMHTARANNLYYCIVKGKRGAGVTLEQIWVERSGVTHPNCFAAPWWCAA